MPVQLFHGDNVLELDESVRRLRQRFEPADTLTFEGAEIPLPTLTEACLTAGLFDPERLVIVHDLHDRLKGNRKEGGEAEALRGVIESVAPTTTLLLVSRETLGDHALVGMVRAAGGEIQTFATPRKAELPKWVAQRAAQQGASIDRDASELLVDLVGGDALTLGSELDKLATYVGAGQSITPSAVEALVGAIPQDSIFSLVDAIAAGDRAKALRLLHAQLEHASSGSTDFALYLIRMLARQIRILLRIRLGQEAGKSSSQLTSELKLPRYYADRYFRQARRLPKDRLTGTFESLAALEHGLKSGKAEAGPGLDILVADLCA